MTLKKLSMDAVELKDKRVLMRVDFNVPIKDGVITNTQRCASFFKRSIRKARQYVCKSRSSKVDSCVVDRAHRKRCKACRLKKCIEAGMKTDAVQHERGLRNSTKQRQTASQLTEAPSSSYLSPHPVIPTMDMMSPVHILDPVVQVYMPPLPSMRIFQPTPMIIAEYTKRKQAILSIEEQLNSIKATVEDLKMRLQEKKGRWLPPLITHIESVNRKFSKYYKILKCAGEISLDQTDDTDDFPNYGLQIKLKHRVNEEFMELSQTHHSGGECSVAAIIFILSLQELTDVPFRCIDEINQGMDAINERNIYQLVADAARSGSCSQYFLLTPKLLMDLSYHKDVAVHTIFNSPFLQTKLNVKEHLKIAKAGRQ